MSRYGTRRMKPDAPGIKNVLHTKASTNQKHGLI